VKPNNIRQNLLKKINARAAVPARPNKKHKCPKVYYVTTTLPMEFFFFFLEVNFGNLATKEIKMEIFCHRFLSSLKKKNVKKI